VSARSIYGLVLRPPVDFLLLVLNNSGAVDWSILTSPTSGSCETFYSSTHRQDAMTSLGRFRCCNCFLWVKLPPDRVSSVEFVGCVTLSP